MTPYALHVVDVIAFIVVLLSAVLASFRGFTREFFGIASWLVSLFFATYATEKTFGFWKGFLHNDLLSNIIGFVTFFVLSLTICTMVTGNIVDRIGNTALNTLDRSAGFLFGFIRGVIILSLIYLIIASFSANDDELPDWAKQSRFMPQIQQSAKILIGILPSQNKMQQKENKEEEQKTNKKEKTTTPTPKQEKIEQKTIIEKKHNNELKPPAKKIIPDEQPKPEPKKEMKKPEPKKEMKKPEKIEKEPATYNNQQRNELDQLIKSVE